MKKIIIFILILTCIGSVSALNNTTISATPTPIARFTEEFYGNINYMDGSPVPAGKIVVAKDQNNNLLGNYTIEKDGVYGSEKPYGNKMTISVFKNPNDRNAGIIFINFFVDDIRAKNTADFKQGESMKFDIVLPVNQQIPTPTPVLPTQTPDTTIIVGTPQPTSMMTATTLIPTPTTLPVITTQTQPPSLIEDLFSPKQDDNTLLLYGLIGGLMILIGIIITGIVQIYLSSKSGQDEVLGPEGRRKV